MDGNANHVGAVPSTTKVRLGHLVTSVPEDRREAVYIMVSEVLLEAVQRAPIPVNTGSEAVAVIATFVPAASLSAPIPQAVRTTFQDVISAIVPRNVILGHNADGAGAGVMGGGAQITIETAKAKEVREKTNHRCWHKNATKKRIYVHVDVIGSAPRGQSRSGIASTTLSQKTRSSPRYCS